MNGRKHEMMHNSREQVREYLAGGLELVEELNPADDLRGIVLTKAIDLLAAKHITIEQIAPIGNGLGLRPGL